MIILGIDPGFERIGISIIEKKHREKESLVYSECFKTKSTLPFYERILLIGQKIEEISIKYKPGAIAIEKLFFTANQKTAMGVAEARGVIIYSAIKHGLRVFEYTPQEIKIAVTGYGKSDKSAIMSMVPKLIKIEKDIKSDDELDAIAIGLTCFACERFPQI
jgi:crossover junction endodeoxyribonuclease RuvC